MAAKDNPQNIPGFGLRGSFGTSKVRGFGDDPKFQFLVKGLNAETGMLRLSHPPMSDLVFRDDSGVCTLRSRGELFQSCPLHADREAMVGDLEILRLQWMDMRKAIKPIRETEP